MSAEALARKMILEYVVSKQRTTRVDSGGTWREWWWSCQGTDHIASRCRAATIVSLCACSMEDALVKTIQHVVHKDMSASVSKVERVICPNQHRRFTATFGEGIVSYRARALFY